MSKVLVTGGLGYIGSHTVIELLQAGHEVFSIDNLYNSEPEVVDRIELITGKRIHNYDVDLCDLDDLKSVMEDHKDIQGVIHFAAYKAVGESVRHPLAYYRNNLLGMLNLFECMANTDTTCFIYSSSCTVYGSPEAMPVTEETPLQEPESPYGQTKRMGEQIMSDFLNVQDGLRGIALRYFNPAGAHPSALLGESPRNVALNLVPVITETAAGLRDEVVIFGDQYDTRDGTCVRDYIHIMDLARAHVLALEKALSDEDLPQLDFINLGIGQGVTVLEAINAFERVSGVSLNYRIGPARSGDVPAIYADSSKAEALLKWKPEYNIDDIMRSAWNWEKARRATSN